MSSATMPTATRLSGEPTETLAALTCPGRYSLTVPPDHQNKLIPLLRRTALAHGYEAVLFVTMGQFVDFTVREKTA